MVDGLGFALVSTMAFVGLHLIFAHPLRAFAVRQLGPGGFQLVYSLLATAGLFVVLLAYHGAPRGPALWPAGHAPIHVAFALAGWFATALFIASLFDNPGLIGADNVDLSTRIPAGVYRITRHPMMFAITIFALAHILVNASPRNVVVLGGLAVLALGGSHLQDRKKIAQTGREWTLWARRTSFWPDPRQLAQLGAIWPLALLVWLLATWLETRLTMVPVGLWYFIPGLPA